MIWRQPPPLVEALRGCYVGSVAGLCDTLPTDMLGVHASTLGQTHLIPFQSAVTVAFERSRRPVIYQQPFTIAPIMQPEQPAETGWKAYWLSQDGIVLPARNELFERVRPGDMITLNANTLRGLEALSKKMADTGLAEFLRQRLNDYSS